MQRSIKETTVRGTARFFLLFKYTFAFCLFFYGLGFNPITKSYAIDEERQVHTRVNISNFTGEYTEFLASISSYDSLNRREGRQNFKQKVGENIVRRGSSLVEKMLARAKEIRGQAEHGEEYRAINELLGQFEKLQRPILTSLGAPFIIVDNINSVSEKTARPGGMEKGFTVINSDILMIGQSWQMKWKHRLWRMPMTAMNSLVHFSSTYSAFMIATGILTFAHLSLHQEDNPGALDDYFNQATDLLGGVSFAAFMATSWFVSNKLRALKSGMIPRAVIPYLGMAAGLVASSLFYELASDPNLHACIKSLFEDTKNCDLAYERWVLHRKILQYVPTVMSLLTSAALSAGVTYLTAKGVQKITDAAKRQGVKGLVMGRVVDGASKAANWILKARYALAIGSFVVFLAFEHFLGPRVMKAFERYKLSVFDLDAHITKHVLHRDYWDYFIDFIGIYDHPEPPVFFIDDVFEVEVTNLPRAKDYTDRMLTNWRENNWTAPEDYQLGRCLASGLMEVTDGELELIEEEDKTYTRLPEDFTTARKPQSMIECEVLSQPLTLIDRFGEIEDVWRSHLLQDYFQSMTAWMKWSSEFAIDYLMIYQFYYYLMQAKFNELNGEEPPDLSSKALLSVLAGFYGDTDALQKPGFFGELRHKLEAIVGGMACGPRVDADLQQGDDIEEGSNIRLGEKFLRPSYGSSISFVVPSVIEKTEEWDPCYGRGAMHRLKISTVDPDGAYSHVFGQEYISFKNGEEKVYPNFMYMVYDNLDPVIWNSSKPSKQSGFNSWWERGVKGPTALAWKKYEQQFKYMYLSNYAPLIGKRSRVNGPAGHAKRTCERRKGKAACGPKPHPYIKEGLIESFEKEFATYSGPALELLELLKAEHPDVAGFNIIEAFLGVFKDNFGRARREIAGITQKFYKKSGGRGGGTTIKVEFDNVEELSEDIVKVFEIFDTGEFEPPTPESILTQITQTDFTDMEQEDINKVINEKISGEAIQRLTMLVQLVHRVGILGVNLELMGKYAGVLNFEASKEDLDFLPEVEDVSNPFISR